MPNSACLTSVPVSELPPTTPRIIELPDGRDIAFAEYGDPGGTPVVFCHGWPATRLQAGLLHEDACKLGARIIAPDRPGVGFSSVQPGRLLTDWPDFLQSLTGALDIDEFRVLGVSGGGPYALAAAWGMPDRIPAISVVCSAPPLADREDVSTLNPAYQWLLRTHRRRPYALRWLFRAARPVANLRPPNWLRARLLRKLPQAEAETLADKFVFDVCCRNYRESWRGGADGLYGDAAIYAEPWGFSLKDVQVPVRLWHGKDDRNFSWELAEEMASILPNCTSRFVENEAHYSLPIRRRGEILADLLAAA